jgi:hypothetical protein
VDNAKEIMGVRTEGEDGAQIKEKTPRSKRRLPDQKRRLKAR